MVSPQKLFQLILLATAILSASLSQTSFSAVGKVTEQTGPTEIVRNKRSTPSAVNAPVEMNDTIVTAKAKAKLTFEDNTTVNITEQSKLIIDDFVYDPKKGSGKIAMKVVLGTARYASGQIAKTNPQNVNVQTPTATVAVRGTDFSMTVDELGRSLVVLLPSCDHRGCVTGSITVKNDAGEAVIAVVTPIQRRYQELMGDPGELSRLLRIGATRARSVAATTLSRAYKAIGLLPIDA